LDVDLEEVAKGEIEPYVDLNITCVAKAAADAKPGEQPKILEGVPLLRARLV